MAPPVSDLTIAGAGPAGLALAVAAAERGLDVVVVDPAPGRPWPNRYAAWAEDLAGTVAEPFVGRRWDRVLVDTGSGAAPVGGSYAQIDRHGLQEHLRDRLLGLDGLLVADRVMAVDHDATGSDLHLETSGRRRTSAFVDATGTGAFLQHPRPPAAFQRAWGELVRVSGHPWAAGEAVLMDFSVDHLAAAEAAGPASFLYALPVSEDLVFVEETSLAAAPPVPLHRLEARLHARLAHLDVEVLERLEVERCHIPMDVPIPRVGRTVGVGAAVGWVHPATGYSVTRSLRRASPIAQALVDGLADGPERAAREAWRAVWPASHRRTRALHDLGLGLLLDFDAARTRAFFETFFALPEPRWRAYLDATSPPGSIASAMSRVLVSLDPELRGIVLRHALGEGRNELFRAFTPQFGGA